MPRVGCSIPCEITNINGSKLNGFVADVSSSGFSFSPLDGDYPEWFPSEDEYQISINMKEFSDIEGDITFNAKVKWKRGLLVGFHMEYIDLSNFKKWWFLIYSLFFPKQI